MNANAKGTKAAARRRRRIRNIIILVVLVAAALTAGVILARNYVTRNFATSTSEVQTAEVTVGSISTTVSGSGTLASEGVEEITYPSSVTLDTVFVSEGDTVSEGDLLASVNTASVISAMASAQASLDNLDAQIAEASDDEVSDTITSGLAGRVKVIYAGEEDDVATVMYENGALLLLSLDGYMAVDVDCDDLAAGDTVTVTDADGNSYSGTVVTSATAVTVLISDEGPAYGAEVTVLDDDENELATGTLYIHEALKITGYAGTVESISVEVDDTVEVGDTLFTLTDTSYSASYDTLLRQREELEETLQVLVALYKQGAIYATISGVVESVSTTTSSYSQSSSMGMTTSSSSGESTLLSIAPDTSMTISVSVDETDILSLELGQEASVTIDSIGTDSYTGTVTEIDTTATSSGGVTQYTAVITIDKQDGMLSGMSASVTITIEGVENALLLPEDAVSQSSTTAYVYTSYDETTGELGDMVQVTVGLSNGSYIEITDGLSEGDTVYYVVSSSTDSIMSAFSTMGGDTAGGMTMGSIDMGTMGGDSIGGMTGGDSAGGMSMGGAPN